MDAVSLLANISAKWQEIGLALNISRNELDGLQDSHNSTTTKLSQVINLWIESESSSPVSWETLISAIEGPIVKKKRRLRRYVITFTLILQVVYMLLHDYILCLCEN